MALVRVRESFSCSIPGNPAFVAQVGQVLDTDHPAYRGRESLFEPVEKSAVRFSPVEQATAAPGERRSRVTRVHKTKESDDG